MKLSLADYGETGVIFSWVSAAWTAAVKPPGWVHGAPGKEYPCLRQRWLLRIRGNQITLYFCENNNTYSASMRNFMVATLKKGVLSCLAVGRRSRIYGKKWKRSSKKDRLRKSYGTENLYGISAA